MSALTRLDDVAVKQFASIFEKLFYEGDGVGMAAYYTQDARLFAEGILPIQGKASIEAFWQTTCSHAKAIDMKRSIKVDEVRTTSELCYAYCTLTLDMTANG